MIDMFLLKSRGNYLECPLKLLELGLRKVKYALLAMNQEPAIVSIINRIYVTLLEGLYLLKKNKKLPTVVLVAKNKRMTLTDKKIFLDTTILTIVWLQISVQDLIGRGKVLKPFWNSQCLENSRKCWLPTETDSVGSPSNSWLGSWKETGRNSLFSMTSRKNPEPENWPTTFFPSFTYIHADKWVDESIRCRSVRIYPNNSQRKFLRSWLGTSRFVYNRALASLKKGEDKPSFQSLRNKYVTFKNTKIVQEWETQTPKDIRAGAIKDLVTAYKSAFTNLKNGNINNFNLGWRTKRKESSISIPKSAISFEGRKVSIYPKYNLGAIKVSRDRCLQDLIVNHDCRLGIKNGAWYLYIPITIPTRKKSSSTTCALDPGVRKFQTIYSEEEVIKITIRRQLIKKLQARIDLLQSLKDQKLVSGSRWKRGRLRVQRKLTYLIDDLHWRTIGFLSRNYSTVIIPRFESQEMSMKNKNRTCNRNLLQLKHFMFRKRLEDKFSLIQGTKVIECTEEYTSQTCTSCGILNKSLGSSEWYSCKNCGLEVDRDINGARNIYLKAFST
jgi:putative transposase